MTEENKQQTTGLDVWLEPLKPWLKFPNHTYLRGKMFSMYQFDPAKKYQTEATLLKALTKWVGEKCPDHLYLRDVIQHPETPYVGTGAPRTAETFRMRVLVSGIQRFRPVTERCDMYSDEHVDIDLEEIHQFLLTLIEEGDDDIDHLSLEIEDTIRESVREHSYDLEEADSTIEYEEFDGDDECWEQSTYEWNRNSSDAEQARREITNWLRENHPTSPVTVEHIYQAIRGVHL